jgi:hypothetical protein
MKSLSPTLCGYIGFLAIAGLFSGPELVAAGQTSPAMGTVRISADNKGFVLQPSGARFIPWGHNYASVDILERLEKEPARVERDFAEMKAAGTTVARVHPEMPSLLAAPEQVNAKAIASLVRLLQIAEKSGVRLHLTGLACYHINRRLAWYDAMDDEHRWKAQEFFWETVARTCAGSPAVFCFDLVNEPAASARRADGWYTGRMGDVEFCQRLSLDQPNRKGDDIFHEWTARMVAAIRRHDRQHLITLGMLPFPGAYKAAVGHLDFVSPHLYPRTGKLAQEIDTLKKFDFGKPIVIGETFPLSCSAEEERTFLRQSRGIAAGWIGHWPDDTPDKLAELKRSGKISIAQAIWLSWVELFREMGPEMLQ